jgi:hypothetical protein
MSTIFFTSVVVTSGNNTTDRVMVGQTVKGQAPVNTGSVQATTLPQLTAQAYLDGTPVAAAFFWESSNPAFAVVDQSGNVSRAPAPANSRSRSYDSNGGNTTGQLGGLSQIRATAKRPDGSLSGVWDEIAIAVQAQGFNTAPLAYLVRNNANLGGIWQTDNTVPNGYAGNPTNNYIPNDQQINYNLVAPDLIGENYSH